MCSFLRSSVLVCQWLRLEKLRQLIPLNRVEICDVNVILSLDSAQ